MTSKPLSSIELLLLPLMQLLARGAARERLNARLKATQQAREEQKQQRELKRLLRPEAKLYHKILINTFTGLGEFYAPASVNSSGNRLGGRRPQKVRFQRCVVTPEIIYFLLETQKKGLFGARRILPHRVRILDLIRDDTCMELSFHCKRNVTVQHDNLRAGVWFKVYRLEGIDGLPRMVTFKNLVEYYPHDMSDAGVVLGIGEHRQVHYASFAKYPHWLVGGSTGSGKSNFINNVISGLIRFTEPTDVRFILIDLKAMEFPFYADAPHLFRPIITEADDAIEALVGLKHEIRKRSRMLSGYAKELAAWNKKYPDRAMPRIICVIDEFAELMIASGSEIAHQAEELVSSITNLGRAVGVHIIVCTQRPAVAVVPNSIKVNMPLVIAGPTPSAHQSQVILDTSDAANLPDILGRMAVRAGARISQIQTPFITDEDILESVKLARGRYLGITQLNGLDPIVNYPGLSQYIIDTLQGWLSTKPLIAEICQYGVTRAQLRAYVTQIIKQETVEAYNGIYKVERQRNSIRLVLLQPFENVLQEQPPEIVEPTITEYPVDPNFVPYALIPAFVPEPAFDKVYIFTQYYCVNDVASKDRASTLFKAYCRYFQDDRPYPLDQRKFGMKLSSLQYTRQKSTGSVIWWYGLRLHSDFKQQMLLDDQDQQDNTKPSGNTENPNRPEPDIDDPDGLVNPQAA